MNIALFGAPGCGKGTQAQLLTQKLDMVQISTGDLFRAALKNQTPVGLKVKKYLDAGHLVPDDITVEVVREAIKVLEKPFILDGFPRNLNQAQILKTMLKELGISIEKFIFFEVPEQILVDRITGRRVCKNCGAIYHAQSKPPQVEGVCDRCGGEVYQRSDDKLELVSERLKVYHQQTQPLKEFYFKEGNSFEVDGNLPSEQVSAKLLSLVNGK